MNYRPKTPYTFSPVGYGIYFAALALMLILMLTRNNSELFQHIDSIGLSGIGSHTSNFALSMFLIFFAGTMSLLNHFSWKHSTLLAIAIIASNFVIELFIPILNTKDIVDAIYGTIGAIVALALLYVMKRYGIQPSG